MRIVFYSSNSNYYEPQECVTTNYPSWNDLWNQFCKLYPEHSFFSVSQKPAMFMPDSTIIVESQETKVFVDNVAALKPDLVIAASFWVTPYDWLPVKDALIADELRALGIDVVCHSKETSLLCFDKYRTMNFLEAKGFCHAPGMFIDHDLYFCAGNMSQVCSNVYKECVLKQLKQMEYPLIIKNPVGLSSYGMAVVNSYNEAYGYLNSKKNNSNRLVEKFIQGEQFGTEIYGRNGNYKVMPPFRLSVNQYGITSPKLCRKSGPVDDEEYKIDELKKELKRLACELKLDGFAQVDLVFGGGHWYIIEINPRLSGMTTTYTAAAGLNFYDYLFRAVTTNFEPTLQPVINKKIPLQTPEQLSELSRQQDVLFISQIQNNLALQERERGYCEVIQTADTEKDEKL